MALINCPECNREISDKASSCPHCGYPISGESSLSTGPSVTEEKAKTDIVKLIKEKSLFAIDKLKTSRKAQIITGCAFLAVVLAIVLPVVLTANSRKYNRAMELYNNGSYSEAVEIFEQIPDYKDSSNKRNEAIFIQAKDLYESEQFADAKVLFEQILEYNGSDVWSQKCDYFQTIDGKFLLDFSKGINARWLAADDDKEYASSQEYIDSLTYLINLELDQISKYKGMTFADERLQQISTEYIDALNLSLDALKYFDADYFRYEEKWSEAYKARTLLITELMTNYDVKVDKENERTAQEFYTNADVYEEQDELEKMLQDCLDKMTFKVIENSYGWKTYEGYFTNETPYTLKNISLEVLFLDSDGTIIEENYTSGADTLEPGQKARYEFSSEEKYSSMQIVIYYDTI